MISKVERLKRVILDTRGGPSMDRLLEAIAVMDEQTAHQWLLIITAREDYADDLAVRKCRVRQSQGQRLW